MAKKIIIMSLYRVLARIIFLKINSTGCYLGKLMLHNSQSANLLYFL